MGVSAEPFRWGELVEMAEGRARHDWDHTSFLAAAVRSCFSDRPVAVADLNPFTSGGKRKQTGKGDGSTKVKLSAVKDLIRKACVF